MTRPPVAVGATRRSARTGLAVAVWEAAVVASAPVAVTLVDAVERALLSQRPSGRLVPPDDDEYVRVDKHHGQQRCEEEARVLASETDTLDEVGRAVGALREGE